MRPPDALLEAFLGQGLARPQALAAVALVRGAADVASMQGLRSLLVRRGVTRSPSRRRSLSMLISYERRRLVTAGVDPARIAHLVDQLAELHCPTCGALRSPR